ncbi:hypothetical protein LZ31DRAFT_561604, partial [Colletotrichum somersetense]
MAGKTDQEIVDAQIQKFNRLSSEEGIALCETQGLTSNDYYQLRLRLSDAFLSANRWRSHDNAPGKLAPAAVGNLFETFMADKADPIGPLDSNETGATGSSIFGTPGASENPAPAQSSLVSQSAPGQNLDPNTAQVVHQSNAAQNLSPQVSPIVTQADPEQNSTSQVAASGNAAPNSAGAPRIRLPEFIDPADIDRGRIFLLNQARNKAVPPENPEDSSKEAERQKAKRQRTRKALFDWAVLVYRKHCAGKLILKRSRFVL